MMTDNNNSYQVQHQDKSPGNSPSIHQSEQLIHDFIEESPPPSASSFSRSNKQHNYSSKSSSSNIEQQQQQQLKQELPSSPNEHQHGYSNSGVYQERVTTSGVSSPDIRGGGGGGGGGDRDRDRGGNGDNWNDADEEKERSSPPRMDNNSGVGTKIYLISNTANTNRPRISSPPLPPPPPAHSYSRLQVPLQQQNNSRNRISPTNWHQPQNQLEYIQQQQHQQQQVYADDSSSQQSQNQNAAPNNAFGMLKHENGSLYITENCVEIGRNSSTSHVHFHVARNSFVSRKHFQVLYDPETCDFYVACLSKNGVFVDDLFQRRFAEPMKLPKSCSFRFPSTEIRIYFESFVDSTSSALNSNTIVSTSNAPASNNSSKMHYFSDRKNLNATSMEASNVIYSPLKISIPKTEQKSPYPSPTGTISAANSCPTSPRQGFQDYQSYSSYNNNNNLQGQDMFQTPSTSNYNDHEKPPYSYAQLIVQSISAAPDKQLTLSGIYSFISKHYPYYRKEANKGWQNSIRHNLSLNRYFIKVARSQDEPGKGSFWRIDPTSEAKLIDQSYKKRRQRGSQCFRPSYGMPRSAPVSPSHIDNSRESSPLHDIVLQSAPGSPGMSYQGHLENHSAEDLMYNSQSVMQSSSYNAHSQYNSSGQQQSIIVSTSGQTSNGTGSNINGGGGHLKRHHSSTVTSAQTINSSGNTQHPEDAYDEVHEYNSTTGGGAALDSGDEYETMKRPKYSSEMNQ